MPRRGCHAFLLTLVTAGSVASMMATPAASAVQSLPQAADSGGGEFVIPKVPHLTNEQRIAIQAQIDRNIAILTAQGRLPAAAAPGVLLGWPLQAQNGVRDFGVHGVSNFVDLDPIFPGSLLDFACGARTYDLSSGNHRGIDYFTWPFPWKRVNNDQVAIVAAAPGTIVLRQDGNFDRSCTFPNNSDWNAVFVRHADGSIAWYGHMKAFSLTSKQVGDSVAQGEFLGIVGSSGNSSGPHLHLEIHDPSGTVVEPHSGPCNPITSWWAQQRPYFDSSVNKMTTGFAAAVMPSCPQEEIPNDSTNFNSGGTVFFTTYYRDQRINQVSQYTIYRPSGAIWTRWTHSITNPHFAASWWWWSFNLAGVEPGIWKFEVVYQGRTFNHSFSIGGPFPVGRVPGDSSLGAPLTVSTGAGGNINLSWSGTCLGSETDYAIYEGVIGDYYSHALK
ncbi:MAG: M23 family metallopeptidase, partial [Acidobacteriota bacterium]